MNKKGMEMWQLIMIFLAIALLVFLLWWYSDLGGGLEGMLDKMGGLFVYFNGVQFIWCKSSVFLMLFF